MNHEQERADSEHIHNLKDLVLDSFRQLPAEHQASLGLVLASSIAEGEWGTWFQEALSSRLGGEHAQETGALCSVSRADLQEVGFSEQEISQLTDDDLSTVARMITEHWTTDVFRDDLFVITEMVLERKSKP